MLWRAMAIGHAKGGGRSLAGTITGKRGKEKVCNIQTPLSRKTVAKQHISVSTTPRVGGQLAQTLDMEGYSSQRKARRNLQMYLSARKGGEKRRPTCRHFVDTGRTLQKGNVGGRDDRSTHD